MARRMDESYVVVSWVVWILPRIVPSVTSHQQRIACPPFANYLGIQRITEVSRLEWHDEWKSAMWRWDERTMPRNLLMNDPMNCMFPLWWFFDDAMYCRGEEEAEKRSVYRLRKFVCCVFGQWFPASSPASKATKHSRVQLVREGRSRKSRTFLQAFYFWRILPCQSPKEQFHRLEGARRTHTERRLKYTASTFTPASSKTNIPIFGCHKLHGTS